MVFLDVVSVLAALIGGVGAVTVAQILSLYRDDIDSARELRYHIEYLEELLNPEKSGKASADSIRRAKSSLEEQYIGDYWLVSGEGHKMIREVLAGLENLETKEDEDRERGERQKIRDEIINKCQDIDGEIAYVTIGGACDRYLGDERPYEDYSDI